MPPGVRQMMPASSAKMQQPSQMEMPRMTNGPVSSDWQSRITTPKSVPVGIAILYSQGEFQWTSQFMH